jgi:iron complex transport system substrate-binding protein
MRIVSFLPAATEMIYLLGLQDQLVGRSHECDYPPQVRDKPVIVDCALDLSALSLAEIDVAVTRQLAAGNSLYKVDEATLRTAAPDLLVTQNLCQVCGPAGNEVIQVLKTMPAPPRIVWQTPRSFDEMLDAVRTLGIETGTQEKAENWIEGAVARIHAIASTTVGLEKIRVSFLEWVDPVFCGGHWIPQMLEWAGGVDRNSRHGTDSIRIAWPDVLDYQPDVIVIAPCGFNTVKARQQAVLLQQRAGWSELPAVRSGRVYAVDANAYFARPGPRLVEGVELLAHLIHPATFAWSGPADAFCLVD